MWKPGVGRLSPGGSAVGLQGRVSGLLPNKGCTHQPSACSAEGRRSLSVIPTPAFWDKEQPCDAECKSKGRQYTANFLGAGAREPLTAGFPDGRAAGWLSIFLGGSSVSERPGPLAALHQRSSWSLAAFRASATGSCPLCGRAQLQDGASCWSRRCPSFASPVLGK